MHSFHASVLEYDHPMLNNDQVKYIGYVGCGSMKTQLKLKKKTWLHLRANSFCLSHYCIYDISGSRQEREHPHTERHKESERKRVSLKHTGQTGLIGEENQTPAAAVVWSGAHPLSKLSLTTTNKDTRKHLGHNRACSNKAGTGAGR